MFADGNSARGGALVRQAAQRGARRQASEGTSRIPFDRPSKLSVFSNWYTTILVDLLHEEKGAD